MRLLAAGFAAVFATLAPASLTTVAASATAHPLGAFSVNQYAGLTFRGDGVRVVAAVDTAEIPTQQDRSIVDTNGDGTPSGTERAGYAHRACADLAAGFDVTADGQRIAWIVEPGGYEYQPGASGLPTARLACTLLGAYRFDKLTTVAVANRYRGDRIGWHELTASAVGLRLVDSELPERSITEELRAFPTVAAPADLLDVRTAVLRVAPASATVQRADVPTPAPHNGPLATVTAWTESRFQHLASGRLTPLLAIASLLLAVLLGAGHAALPGHGKTVLAAYLAGRQGRPRDALAVAGVVTVTHTVGVLVLGLLLATSTALAGDRVLRYLGLASGLLVVGVGVAMTRDVLRRRRATTDQVAHRHLGHDHRHDHDQGHDHDHAHHGRRRGGWLSLTSMGVAGGLVPSPSALVVLLAAMGLGRAVFGMLLVVAYGVGMAATLVGTGLLLLAVRSRVSTAEGWLARFAALLPRVSPVVTAGLVLVVGLGLTVRSAAGW